MRGKRGRRILAGILRFLAAVLLWLPSAGFSADAASATNQPVVVRKAPRFRPAPDLQWPNRQSPDRPRDAKPQAKLYFGSRLDSVTPVRLPQNPYESNYASVQHSYHKALVGFRLALTSHAYVFVGLGMAISDDLLEQRLAQSVGLSAAQAQNSLAMQTEYGLGWDF